MALKLKECSVCCRTYADETLSFCLMDGSVLSAPFISEEIEFPATMFGEEITVIKKQKIPIKTVPISVTDKELIFGDYLTISFERTLRIPDDGKRYSLPASLGSLPIFKVSDFADTVPGEWNRHGGVFIPMYQREALFINFLNRERWLPNAVKVATGKINAITGQAWHQSILDGEQDYVVVPPQAWMDGYKTGTNVVRQFVAVQQGVGYTVESQVSGNETVGGIQLIVYMPNDGVFSPPPLDDSILKSVASSSYEPKIEMGIGAGGRIEQRIYPDEHGAGTWDEKHFGRVFVHIVDSSSFTRITGLSAPKSPIDVATYERYRIPWFRVYDEGLGDIETSEKLYGLKPVSLLDKMAGAPYVDPSPIISEDDVKTIKITNQNVDDGDW